MKVQSIAIAALITLALITQTQPLEARTWYILPDGTGDAPTIQAGIDLAAAGDTVLVGEGTYLENLNFWGKAIIVASHFLLDGNPFHIEATVVDGSQPTHPDSGSVVMFHSAEDTTSVLMGFTFTGGRGTRIERTDMWGTYYVWVGGGIIGYYASPLIRNNRFQDNSVHEGGGIYLESSAAVIHDCSFDGNHAFSGGAIRMQFSDVVFRGNRVEGNSAGIGGGLYVEGYRGTGSLIMGNTVVGNTSTDHGAGMVVTGDDGVSSQILSNWIEGNVAGMGGGGIYCRDASPYIYRNFIVANTGQGWTGGGVRCVRSRTTILNNTFHANGSFGGGGGGAISFFDGINGAVPVIANNIISDSAGMRAIKCNPNDNRIGYNDIWNSEQEDIDCELIFPNLFVDPMYVDAESGDFTLWAGSQCIDAGVALWIVEDEVWVDIPESEYYGEAPDMGASEYEGPSRVGNSPPPSQTAWLEQIYPNPFNPLTAISFSVNRPQQVKIIVFDMTGRQIAVLTDRPFSPGTHSVGWNGRDTNSHPVSSGTYLVRMETDDVVESRKVMLVR